jgi:Terpene cyclase DEP1
MTTQLFYYGVLGVLSTAAAFYVNRRLFGHEGAGKVSALEGVYYFVAVCSLLLGWYFNVRYVHAYRDASYTNYVKMLFSNWAADSAAQDYTIVNLVLVPLWTISEGRRKGIRIPWIFFVMSLFTSLAFSMAVFLAFVERQNRHARAEPARSSTS